jgi:anti-anti-sigma regulatory factor
MDRITLCGVADPRASFELRDALEPLTCTLRPHVVVDLSDVDDLHPAVVSVLLRHRRQARRQGGDVHLIRPTAAAARRTLDHVGLVDVGR